MCCYQQKSMTGCRHWHLTLGCLNPRLFVWCVCIICKDKTCCKKTARTFFSICNALYKASKEYKVRCRDITRSKSVSKTTQHRFQYFGQGGCWKFSAKKTIWYGWMILANKSGSCGAVVRQIKGLFNDKNGQQNTCYRLGGA